MAHIGPAAYPSPSTQRAVRYPNKKKKKMFSPPNSNMMGVRVVNHFVNMADLTYEHYKRNKRFLIPNI